MQLQQLHYLFIIAGKKIKSNYNKNIITHHKNTMIKLNQQNQERMIVIYPVVRGGVHVERIRARKVLLLPQTLKYRHQLVHKLLRYTTNQIIILKCLSALLTFFFFFFTLICQRINSRHIFESIETLLFYRTEK